MVPTGGIDWIDGGHWNWARLKVMSLAAGLYRASPFLGSFLDQNSILSPKIGALQNPVIFTLMFCRKIAILEQIPFAIPCWSYIYICTIRTIHIPKSSFCETFPQFLSAYVCLCLHPWYWRLRLFGIGCLKERGLGGDRPFLSSNMACWKIPPTSHCQS